MTTTPTPKRGFASLSLARRSEVAAEGGRAAHQMGLAHTFTSEEARAAGRKGAAARKLKKIGHQQRAA